MHTRPISRTYFFADACGMLTWIGVEESSEAAPSVIRTDLSERYDCTQLTRYSGKSFVVIISASRW